MYSVEMKKGSKTYNQDWIPISSNDFQKDSFNHLIESISERHFFNDNEALKQLESHFKEYLDTSKEIVCLSSGTAAIHISLLLAGVKKDDYVLCQSFTYVASVNPVSYIGAHPIFIDSNESDWNLDLDLLEAAIHDLNGKGIFPKALIAVDNYGMPSDIKRLMSICNLHSIKLIEDSAESLGSKFDSIPSGLGGDYGIFSLNNNKILSSGGGGILVCNDSDEKEHAIYLSRQARSMDSGYLHEEIGYNYKLSNIQAILALSQITSLSANLTNRRRNHDFYINLFEDTKEIDLFTEPNSRYYSNHWLNCIVLDPSQKNFVNKDIYQALSNVKIESRFLWRPMHMQPVFEGCMFYANGVSERLYRNGLCLPSGSNLSESDFERIHYALLTYL